jgi:hypothetical protein
MGDISLVSSRHGYNETMQTTGTTILLVTLTVSLGLVTITFLKGKFWMGLISLVIGGAFVSIFGATRLAKPDSWWAERFYDDDKRHRARQRFGGSAQEYAPPPIAEMFR